MTFMEVMGGWWEKDLPSDEEFENQAKLMEKLNIPKEKADHIPDLWKNATEKPKTEYKDLGNGVYCMESHAMGQVSIIKFTLDGKPTENEKPLGSEKMMLSSVFEDGVWKVTVQTEGCPDIIMERKRVGDEIHQTKTCEGVVFREYEKKM